MAILMLGLGVWGFQGAGSRLAPAMSSCLGHGVLVQIVAQLLQGVPLLLHNLRDPKPKPHFVYSASFLHVILVNKITTCSVTARGLLAS